MDACPSHHGTEYFAAGLSGSTEPRTVPDAPWFVHPWGLVKSRAAPRISHSTHCGVDAIKWNTVRCGVEYAVDSNLHFGKTPSSSCLT